MVVYDWRDKVVGALLMPIPLSNSIVDLEALACRHAIQFLVISVFIELSSKGI